MSDKVRRDLWKLMSLQKTKLEQCGLIAFLSASSYIDYFIIKTRLQTLPVFTAECMKHREWTEDIFVFRQRNLVLIYSGMEDLWLVAAHRCGLCALSVFPPIFFMGTFSRLWLTKVSCQGQSISGLLFLGILMCLLC